jgi:hypothetical protein
VNDVKWFNLLKRRAGRKDSYSFGEYGSITPMPYIGGRTETKPRKLTPEQMDRRNKKIRDTKKRNEEEYEKKLREKKEAKYTGGKFLDDKPEELDPNRDPPNPFKRSE